MNIFSALDNAASQMLAVLAGVLVALVVGHFGTSGFHSYLTKQSGLKPRSKDEKRVPSGLTGTFERTLTFVLVLHSHDSQTLVLAWLAAKLAANWQRDEPSGKPEVRREYRTRTLIALMSGIVSVAFGWLGGSIALQGLERLWR